MAKLRRKKTRLVSEEVIDQLFDDLCEEAKKYYGQDNIFTGGEAERQIIGLPFPALSLCYLFQSNVLPLTRMGQIVGEEGSCKSSLLYELFRIVRTFGGRSVLLEAETKDSPILRKSILNYDENAIIYKRCDSLEDWQEGLTYFLKWAKQKFDGTKSAPGPGRIRPMLFGIDSLMGKGCRDTIERINKDGCAQRAFPAEALLISQYMKYMPQQLVGCPFAVWGINHLKPATDPRTGTPKNNIAGGKSLKFQETYEIEMHRVKDIKKVDIQGITTKLMMRKNSLGQSRLSINVDMLWWFDEEHDYIQRTFFDWHTASIDLLLAFEGSRGTKLQSICDLHVVDKSKKIVWSNALGISRSSPITFREAGEILQNTPDVLRELYKLLHVYEYQTFQPGIDYRTQLEEAKSRVVETMAVEPAKPKNEDE